MPIKLQKLPAAVRWGLAVLCAAVCGVWLHGAAADVCAAHHSMQGMLPEDILPALCTVFLENGR